MAGFSKIFVIGGRGGFAGFDGVDPIELIILVGNSDRQWLEPHYFDRTVVPIGQIRTIIPAAPNDAAALLDACLAFCPHHFSACASMASVRAALKGSERLDFHLGAEAIPSEWASLREEARPLFESLGIWQADLKTVRSGTSIGKT